MDKFIFTNKGLEYAAKTATGSILMFTKGKFGDGTASGDIAKLTDLVKPLGELQISKKMFEGNQVTIETQFTNTTGRDSTLPAFHLKEIGLFAKLQTSSSADDPKYPETLVCYARSEGSDIGDYIPTTPTEFIINWPFSISNADNVKITVSLGAFALQTDLDNAERNFKNHKESSEIDHPDSSVTNRKIKDGAITESKLAGGAVTHVKLAENSVWEANLGRLSVTNDKIANDAVTFNKIQDGAILDTKIADSAVGAGKIHDRAVTSVKIDKGAVEHENIADNAVWESQLGQLSVTNEKIANDAVTSNKILDGAVTSSEISDNAVTENKIHDRAVTSNKIGKGAVVHESIANNSVWEAQIGSQAVTTDKLKDGGVTAKKLSQELNSKLANLESKVTVSSLDFSSGFGVDAFAKITDPTLCAIADVMFCRHQQSGISVCGRAKFQAYLSETAENEKASIVLSDIVGKKRDPYDGYGNFSIVKHTDGTYYLAFDNFFSSTDNKVDYRISGLNVEAITPKHLSLSSYSKVVESEAIEVE